MSKIIVAVDPGKISGIAWYMPDDKIHGAWELPCWDAIRWVDETLTTMRDVEAVVCEDYIITAQTLKKTRGENWSLESIGALRYLTVSSGVPFILQTPGDAKRFSTDAKLRRAGWWHPTDGGHANDASRHLMLYLTRTDRLSMVL